MKRIRSGGKAGQTWIKLDNCVFQITRNANNNVHWSSLLPGATLQVAKQKRTIQIHYSNIKINQSTQFINKLNQSICDTEDWSSMPMDGEKLEIRVVWLEETGSAANQQQALVISDRGAWDLEAWRAVRNYKKPFQKSLSRTIHANQRIDYLVSKSDGDNHIIIYKWNRSVKRH